MAKRLTPKTVAEEPRRGVSKDEATDGLAWFETALTRLLTMRVLRAGSLWM
jgi:hypothetical protein